MLALSDDELPPQMTTAEPLVSRLILGSRFENIEVAARALLDLCELAKCRGDDEYWLVTALREAVANAVRHGNQQDRAKKVTVELAIEDCQVTIRVEDEGDGFDPEAIPDPTDPKNLLRPCGRGIFYMRQFMNHVEFGRTPTGGTAVVMVRRLTPTKARSTSNEKSHS